MNWTIHVFLLLVYSSYSSNPEQCIRECHSLLEDSTVDTAVRAGDIYGVLVTHYAHQQQYKEVKHEFVTCMSHVHYIGMYVILHNVLYY